MKDCTQCREQHMTHGSLPSEGGFMERLSDLIGSTRGIWMLAGIEVIYMVTAQVTHFDPYPFGFLTLVLSLIALQFSQIIIVVQNRQGAILESKAAKEREEVTQNLDMDRKAFALLTDLHDKLIPVGSPSDVVDVPADVEAQKK